ncbi:MAG: hypothetical protein ACI4M8_04065 [Christensenellales bacterium]
MPDIFTEKLLDSIKNDDVTAFDECNAQSPCGAICLGRFPVLSVMYLFSSRKLIAKYEEKFIKNNAREPLPEPTELSSVFRKKAGKCLRLYAEEIVSPLEMLLILDKTTALKRIYPSARPSSAVKARLKTLYSIKYGLNLDFNGDEIVMDRRPLTRKEKNRLITAAISAFLCIAIAVGTPFVVNAFVPFIGVDDPGQTDPDSPENPSSPDNPDNPSSPSEGDSGKKYYSVSSADDIDFSSNNTYTLVSDVVFPENYYAETMSCVLNGDGKTITVTGDKPLFGTVTGTVKNLTVNCTTNAVISDNFAFIAERNLGVIENVTLNVSGKITAYRETSTEDEVGVIAGGIAAENGSSGIVLSYAKISSCKVNYDLTLEGNLYANATFGGIVGTNYAYVTDCSASGNISSDTFDVAGICAENAYRLTNDTNNASIKQVSSAEGWSPMISGVCSSNYAYISNCVNNGVLEGESPSALDVFVGGIVVRNFYSISISVNFASINAKTQGNSYVGGIASCTYNGVIYQCLNDGRISAVGGSPNIGGITGLSGSTQISGTPCLGFVQNCISRGDLEATPSEENRAFIGGITGRVTERLYDEGTENERYYGGGVLASYFIGNILSDGEKVFRGGIVGLCGKNTFGNSYVASNGTGVYFKDNYYFDGCGADIGVSRVTEDDEIFTEGSDVGSLGVSKEEIFDSGNYNSALQSLSGLLGEETDG